MGDTVSNSFHRAMKELFRIFYLELCSSNLNAGVNSINFGLSIKGKKVEEAGEREIKKTANIEVYMIDPSAVYFFLKDSSYRDLSNWMNYMLFIALFWGDPIASYFITFSPESLKIGKKQNQIKKYLLDMLKNFFGTIIDEGKINTLTIPSTLEDFKDFIDNLKKLIESGDIEISFSIMLDQSTRQGYALVTDRGHASYEAPQVNANIVFDAKALLDIPTNWDEFLDQLENNPEMRKFFLYPVVFRHLFPRLLEETGLLPNGNITKKPLNLKMLERLIKILKKHPSHIPVNIEPIEGKYRDEKDSKLFFIRRRIEEIKLTLDNRDTTIELTSTRLLLYLLYEVANFGGLPPKKRIDFIRKNFPHDVIFKAIGWRRVPPGHWIFWYNIKWYPIVYGVPMPQKVRMGLVMAFVDHTLKNISEALKRGSKKGLSFVGEVLRGGRRKKKVLGHSNN